MAWKTRNKILAAIALALTIFPFQSCDNSYGISHNNSNSSVLGGGVDGLRYLNYANCPDDKVGLYSSIHFAGDRKSAVLERDNCRDLSSPSPVNMPSVHFLDNATTTLTFNSKVFDNQVAMNQRSTVLACQDSLSNPKVQISIWKIVGSNNSIFGSVTEVGGASTGTLNINVPSNSAPNDFVSTSGQSSQFNLLVGSGNSASVTYTIGSGASKNSPSLICLTQNLPPPPSNAFNDGASDAPVGVPQAPNLLSGYGVRPPWNVAGVDYSVGIPMGTALKDPSTLSMPGVTVDNAGKTVTISASNVTLDGYDFTSNGGYSIEVSSGDNTIIRNSNINSVVQTAIGAGSLTVENCVMDGSIGSPSLYSFIYHQGNGPLVARYNWFKNFPSKGISVDHGPSADIEYNLIQGDSTASLKQALYFSGGTFTSIIADYNTIAQPAATSTSTTEIELYNSAISYSNADIGFNTMLALGDSAHPSLQVNMRIGPGTLSPNSDSAVVHDNYLDFTGTSDGPFWSGIKTPLINYTNNINLLTGDQLTTNP